MIGELPADLSAWIAPGRTAVLVVDMQVDFASPHGAMKRAGADMGSVPAALAAAEAVVDTARRMGVLVAFVGLSANPGTDSPVWRERARRLGQDASAHDDLCRAGTAGEMFVGPTPSPHDLVVRKTRYSAFTGTTLERDLRRAGIDSLLICGLTTECCVAATAMDAFERDFHVFIVEDACAAYEADLHAAALKALSLSCAINVEAKAAQAALLGSADEPRPER